MAFLSAAKYQKVSKTTVGLNWTPLTVIDARDFDEEDLRDCNGPRPVLSDVTYSFVVEWVTGRERRAGWGKYSSSESINVKSTTSMPGKERREGLLESEGSPLFGASAFVRTGGMGRQCSRICEDVTLHVTMGGCLK